MIAKKFTVKILVVALSLATAWAIRGQFGHEQGAAWAGAIGGLALVAKLFGHGIICLENGFEPSLVSFEYSYHLHHGPKRKIGVCTYGLKHIIYKKNGRCAFWLSSFL